MTREEIEKRLKAYARNKERHDGAVLLFRVDDRYEAYQEDAQTVAERLGIAVATGDGLEVAAFHVSALDAYLPQLIFGKCRVLICGLPDEEGEA